jgi:hypothetical protein
VLLLLCPAEELPLLRASAAAATAAMPLHAAGTTATSLLHLLLLLQVLRCPVACCKPQSQPQV